MGGKVDRILKRFQIFVDPLYRFRETLNSNGYIPMDMSNMLCGNDDLRFKTQTPDAQCMVYTYIYPLNYYQM